MTIQVAPHSQMTHPAELPLPPSACLLSALSSPFLSLATPWLSLGHPCQQGASCQDLVHSDRPLGRVLPPSSFLTLGSPSTHCMAFFYLYCRIPKLRGVVGALETSQLLSSVTS